MGGIVGRPVARFQASGNLAPKNVSTSAKATDLKQCPALGFAVDDDVAVSLQFNVHPTRHGMQHEAG
jgi:hypothetical protein